MIRYIIALSVVPYVTNAQTQTFSCQGSDPNWSLEISEEAATFAFLDRTSDLSIPQKSTAEGHDWPQAMTLIGPRDSAIVILHNRTCNGETHEAQVLTQRGEIPILLTGCCTVAD